MTPRDGATRDHQVVPVGTPNSRDILVKTIGSASHWSTLHREARQNWTTVYQIDIPTGSSIREIVTAGCTIKARTGIDCTATETRYIAASSRRWPCQVRRGVRL